MQSTLSKHRKQQLLSLCEYLGENIQNLELLHTALIHSSYAHEHRVQGSISDNERIEFLGDSVLNLIVSTFLYNTFPNMSEGDMTKTRARYVCEQALADNARKLNLGQYILLGRGEHLSGGNDRNSILADAFESVVGAYFLDIGFARTKNMILRLIADELLNYSRHEVRLDYKTQLQEIVQKDSDAVIKYYVVDESGPDHNKSYKVTVSVNDKMFGQGNGKSKKEAEQLAAKQALAYLEQSS